jgi:hypothetical protein
MASNPIFAILWVLVLFFIAWPVAFFAAGIWVFIQVSSASKICERLTPRHLQTSTHNFVFLFAAITAL